MADNNNKDSINNNIEKKDELNDNNDNNIEASSSESSKSQEIDSIMDNIIKALENDISDIDDNITPKNDFFKDESKNDKESDSQDKNKEQESKKTPFNKELQLKSEENKKIDIKNIESLIKDINQSSQEEIKLKSNNKNPRLVNNIDSNPTPTENLEQSSLYKDNSILEENAINTNTIEDPKSSNEFDSLVEAIGDSDIKVPTTNVVDKGIGTETKKIKVPSNDNQNKYIANIKKKIDRNQNSKNFIPYDKKQDIYLLKYFLNKSLDIDTKKTIYTILSDSDLTKTNVKYIIKQIIKDQGNILNTIEYIKNKTRVYVKYAAKLEKNAILYKNNSTRSRLIVFLALTFTISLFASIYNKYNDSKIFKCILNDIYENKVGYLLKPYQSSTNIAISLNAVNNIIDKHSNCILHNHKEEWLNRYIKDLIYLKTPESLYIAENMIRGKSKENELWFERYKTLTDQYPGLENSENNNYIQGLSLNIKHTMVSNNTYTIDALRYIIQIYKYKMIYIKKLSSDSYEELSYYKNQILNLYHKKILEISDSSDIEENTSNKVLDILFVYNLLKNNDFKHNELYITNAIIAIDNIKNNDSIIYLYTKLRCLIEKYYLLSDDMYKNYQNNLLIPEYNTNYLKDSLIKVKKQINIFYESILRKNIEPSYENNSIVEILIEVAKYLYKVENKKNESYNIIQNMIYNGIKDPKCYLVLSEIFYKDVNIEQSYVMAILSLYSYYIRYNGIESVNNIISNSNSNQQVLVNTEINNSIIESLIKYNNIIDNIGISQVFYNIAKINYNIYKKISNYRFESNTIRQESINIVKSNILISISKNKNNTDAIKLLINLKYDSIFNTKTNDQFNYFKDDKKVYQYIYQKSLNNSYISNTSINTLILQFFEAKLNDYDIKYQKISNINSLISLIIKHPILIKDNSGLIYKAAFISYYNKNYKDAEQLLNFISLSSENNLNPNVNFFLGTIQLIIGKFKEAEINFSKTLEYYNSYINIYKKSKKDLNANDKKIINKIASTYNNMGVMYFAQDKYTSISTFNKARLFYHKAKKYFYLSSNSESNITNDLNQRMLYKNIVYIKNSKVSLIEIERLKAFKELQNTWTNNITDMLITVIDPYLK